MSWQDYVDKQLMASRCVTKAAIAGHDGNVWAKSEGFELSLNASFFSELSGVSPPLQLRSESVKVLCSANQISKDEVAKIVAGFENESLLTSGGVTIAGTRYIYLSGTDRIIRAKLGKVGVHCMKTQQAVVISLYEEPIQPQQAASVVEKLGDYLITCGY